MAGFWSSWLGHTHKNGSLALLSTRPPAPGSWARGGPPALHVTGRQPALILPLRQGAWAGGQSVLVGRQEAEAGRAGAAWAWTL